MKCSATVCKSGDCTFCVLYENIVKSLLSPLILLNKIE